MEINIQSWTHGGRYTKVDIQKLIYRDEHQIYGDRNMVVDIQKTYRSEYTEVDLRKQTHKGKHKHIDIWKQIYGGGYTEIDILT